MLYPLSYGRIAFMIADLSLSVKRSDRAIAHRFSPEPHLDSNRDSNAARLT